MFRFSMFFLSFVLFSSNQLHAKVWEIGPDKNYKTPCSVSNLVSDSDTIRIDAAVYAGDVCSWTANNLHFIGIGDDYAVLDADGKYAQGKAIWVIKGNDCVVENIEFKNCKVPDKNGAGIRQEGVNLRVEHCYFHHNEMGILAGDKPNSTIEVRYSEFAHNGFGDGYSHNIYVNHIERFVFEFNYSHHAYIGHNVKSRALNNEIQFNRIMDEFDGESSMLLDLPNGGKSIIIGNLFYESQESENSRSLTYGVEGLSNPNSQLLIANNTFVSERSNGQYIAIADGSQAIVQNNLFYGQGELVNGVASMLTNFYETELDQNELIDLENFDYHLVTDASVIDQGSSIIDFEGNEVLWAVEYVHPNSSKTIIFDDMLDIGAYQIEKPQAVILNQETSLSIYPNPNNGQFIISGLGKDLKVRALSIYHSNGTIIRHHETVNNLMEIQLLNIPSGLYYCRIILQNNTIQIQPFQVI